MYAVKSKQLDDDNGNDSSSSNSNIAAAGPTMATKLAAMNASAEEMKPLKITQSHNTDKLARINERKLNNLLGQLPNDVLARIIRKKIPPVSKVRQHSTRLPRIPASVKRIVLSLRLMDEPLIENRIKIFIGYCKFKNYSFNTTTRYFNVLRTNNIFRSTSVVDVKTDDDAPNVESDDESGHQVAEESTYDIEMRLRPNKIAFIDSGNIHIRIVSMADFRTFVAYMFETMSQFNAPILIAVFTGLRTSEILQFSTYTLYQLATRQHPVSIKRKQTVVSTLDPLPIYWQPIYNTHLNSFVTRLIDDIFKLEYNSFIQTKINTKLFQITPKTVGNRLRSIYFNAVGKAAPFGFGVHSCRNMIAMLMAEKSENIAAIQDFLQHKNRKTTRRYIKADYTFTTNEFNRITNLEFKNTIDTLNRITSDTTPTTSTAAAAAADDVKNKTTR